MYGLMYGCLFVCLLAGWWNRVSSFACLSGLPLRRQTGSILSPMRTCEEDRHGCAPMSNNHSPNNKFGWRCQHGVGFWHVGSNVTNEGCAIFPAARENRALVMLSKTPRCPPLLVPKATHASLVSRPPTLHTKEKFEESWEEELQTHLFMSPSRRIPTAWTTPANPPSDRTCSTTPSLETSPFLQSIFFPSSDFAASESSPRREIPTT